MEYILGLSENSNPSDKFENESGKSSESLSLIYSILTLLRYSRPAKIPADEFSDSPKLFAAGNRHLSVRAPQTKELGRFATRGNIPKGNCNYTGTPSQFIEVSRGEGRS